MEDLDTWDLSLKSHNQKILRDKKILRIKLAYSWQDVFKYFGITRYEVQGERLVAPCPVHGGDNFSAFNLNIDPNSEFFGNWFCNSHRCHEKFGRDTLGLLYGIMNSLDDRSSFNQAVDLAVKLSEGCSINVDAAINDSVTSFLLRGKKENKKIISRNTVRSRLKIPSKWYIEQRGFSAEILDDFDIGDCDEPNTQMYGRTVFPVYSEDGESMIGCTGRRHDGGYNKWINSKGFNKSSWLYGYHKAVGRAKELSSIILVEGQGDVLRMHEHGIINTVGLFGLSLSESQEFLLQRTGIMTVILGLDNNPAGQEASDKIEYQLSNFFNIRRLHIPNNDIGEMRDLQVIRDQIKDLI